MVVQCAQVLVDEFGISGQKEEVVMKRAGLSREKILEAAVALIDREGLSALSMRRLGSELGVEAMSLYRYVRNKTELLDGVFEAVAQKVTLPVSTGVWKEDAQGFALAFFAVLWEHPQAIPLFAQRPAVTPASLHYVDRSLGVLIQAGFAPGEALSIFELIISYILGFAMLHHPNASSHHPSLQGADVDLDYQQLSPQEFPHLTQLFDTDLTYDAERAFLLGLHAMLSGLASSLSPRV